MKIMIIYDSQFGNTKEIAEAIQEGLGEDHNTKIFRAREVQAQDVYNDTDLLIVGSPTQGGSYSQPVKTFLGELSNDSLQGICAVSFDTSTLTDNHGFVVNTLTRLLGNAAPKISKELSKKGARCVDSEVFYVIGKKGPLIQGEQERARAWAAKILKKASKHQSADPSGPVT